MKHKIALFYVLVTSLCLAAFVFVIFHALGYRVNRSDSLPGRVYRITPLREDERLNVGDCVAIDLSRISSPVITQGIERGYVSMAWNQPMLKRIGAIPGDSVELRDSFLLVNGVASRMTVTSQDSSGGKLSAVLTPITLPPGFYWLVSDPDRGFDSRYFGPIHRNAFTHRARPALH